MSQYPPPYSPQQPAYGGYPPPEPPLSPDELLAPARRAGTLMIVVGALSVLCGLYIAWQSGFDASSAPTPELQRQMQQQIETVEQQTGVSFRTVMLIMGIGPLVAGALLGGLGFYVRGGSFAFVIAGAVVVGGMLVITGLTLLIGLLSSAAMGGPVVALVFACQCGVPFAMLSVLMVWLVQAARNGARIATARQQYQAQLWQYQQYRQAYLQNPQQQQTQPGRPPTTGMGYHGPPPAPLPPQPGSSSDIREPPDSASPPG